MLLGIKRKILHWLYPSRQDWYVDIGKTRLCMHLSGHKWFEIETDLESGFMLFQHIPGLRAEFSLGVYPTMSEAMQVAQNEFYDFLDRCILNEHN